MGLPDDAAGAVSRAAPLPIQADWPRDYPLEQEYSLELPLGYVPDAFDLPPRIGILLHAFHIDLLPQFRVYLDHIPFPADLFISSDTEAKCDAAGRLFADWPNGSLEIRCMRNCGRDVAPKIVGFAAAHEGYGIVLHLHTKRSAHESGLAGWRGYLLEALMGSADTIRGVLEIFRQVPAVGLLAPQQIDMLRPWIRWGENHAMAEGLANRMGFPLPRDAPLDFPAGSMFWARPAALRPLLDLNLDLEEFQEEAGQTDGTLAHAIERLYFLACEQAGFDWMKIAPAGLLNDERGVIAVSDPLALRRFVARTKLRLSDLRDQKRAHGEYARIVTLPPRPLRPLPVSWRDALGVGLAASGRIAIILPVSAAGDAEISDGIAAAQACLPRGSEAWTIALRASASGPGGRYNTALSAGFAAGADMVLVLGQTGVLHPMAILALLQMSAARNGRALIELSTIPQFCPKPVEPDSFAVSAACGPALAVPREIFATLGALLDLADEALIWRDYSARAVAAGFAVRQCPRALFFPTAFGFAPPEKSS